MGLMIGIFIPVTTLCCPGAPSQAQANPKDTAKCFGSETFCVEITLFSWNFTILIKYHNTDIVISHTWKSLD